MSSISIPKIDLHIKNTSKFQVLVTLDLIQLIRFKMSSLRKFENLPLFDNKGLHDVYQTFVKIVF